MGSTIKTAKAHAATKRMITLSLVHSLIPTCAGGRTARADRYVLLGLFRRDDDAMDDFVAAEGDKNMMILLLLETGVD
jgi:hypothetical protein